jgi:hypothetical protein
MNPDVLFATHRFSDPWREAVLRRHVFSTGGEGGDKPAFGDVLKQALRVYRAHRLEVERDGVDLNRQK